MSHILSIERRFKKENLDTIYIDIPPAHASDRIKGNKRISNESNTHTHTDDTYTNTEF